jgi:hypothetical protein
MTVLWLTTISKVPTGMLYSLTPGRGLTGRRSPDGTTLLTNSADHHIRTFILLVVPVSLYSGLMDQASRPPGGETVALSAVSLLYSAISRADLCHCHLSFLFAPGPVYYAVPVICKGSPYQDVVRPCAILSGNLLVDPSNDGGLYNASLTHISGSSWRKPLLHRIRQSYLPLRCLPSGK